MLATGEAISRRLQTDPCWRVCSNQVDSTFHALFDCPLAKSVWKKAERMTVLKSLRSSSFSDLLYQLFSTLSPNLVVEFCIWSWPIWTARNEAIFQSKFPCISSILAEGVTWLERLNEAWVDDLGSSLLDYILMGLLRFGVVVRRPTGEIRSGLSYQGYDAEVVEALALLRAVRWAILHGFSSVQFRGDCLSLIHKLLSSVIDLSPNGHLVELIRSLLCTCSSFSFRFVRRDVNGAAHCLASHGMRTHSIRGWFSDFPSDVIFAALADFLIS